MASLVTFIKDPDATLDYTLDWSPWLDGDTIDTSSWTIALGISTLQNTNTTTTTTIWVEGGAAGSSYDIINTILTVGGRTDQRTITLQVQEH